MEILTQIDDLGVPLFHETSIFTYLTYTLYVWPFVVYVWYGMVRYGMVCYGMEWYGTVLYVRTYVCPYTIAAHKVQRSRWRFTSINTSKEKT